MKIKIPKIPAFKVPKTWAFAIMGSFIVVGIFAVITSFYKEESQQATVSLIKKSKNKTKTIKKEMPTDKINAKGHYDTPRGTSLKKIKETLNFVTKNLTEKHSIILTIQADHNNIQEVQKWLPTALNDDIILIPLLAATDWKKD